MKVLFESGDCLFVEEDNMFGFVYREEKGWKRHLESATSVIGNVLLFLALYDNTDWHPVCRFALEYFGEEMVAMVVLEGL